jgi:hypothetical protein
VSSDPIKIGMNDASVPGTGGTGGSGGVAGTGGSGGTGSSGGASSPVIAGCAIFPSTNEWNRVIASDPVDPSSARYMASMNATGTRKIHPDFGASPYGIPWITVAGSQAMVPVKFEYDDSDPGPYPLPQNAPIEGGASASGDRHVLVLEKDNCRLYETFDSHYVGPGWSCGSGAIFDLKSNALRPAGYTSADAAGLPILPGLVRRAEVMSGKINHALRFTANRTQAGYVLPARHLASSNTDPGLPPMGLRVRLKASYDISGFSAGAKVVLTALKQYGMFLADHGSDFFISGETNDAWEDATLDDLKKVPASAFEAVKHGPIQR